MPRSVNPSPLYRDYASFFPAWEDAICAAAKIIVKGTVLVIWFALGIWSEPV